MDVKINVRLGDAASTGLKAIEQAALQSQSRIAAATARTAVEAEKSASNQRSSFERLAQSREVLGIRSETAIQREIQRTQAAYNRMAAAGQSSQLELSRAAEETTRRITRLTNEMGRLTEAQKKVARESAAIEKAQSGLRTGATAAAGITAAAYTMRAPIQNAMSFDERMARMANTAFAERDFAGRKAGMATLENAINSSVRQSGGTRDQAASALDFIMASGAVPQGDALKMLPALMKASSASGAAPEELAGIAVRSMQSFKIKASDLPNVMNMALTAGQAGGFELKDMAKWLPQQMAAATQSGLSGKAGFAKLAALNQAAVITAGSKDEAGNNVVNLLAKINSADTAKDAQRLGVNLPKYLQQQRAKGIDSVDAFGALVQKTVASDKSYQALQKQLAAAKTNDERRATLESMAGIAQGAGVGKLVQDRQAMMALLAMMNNQGYMQEVLGKINASDVGSGGAIDKNQELIASTAAFQARKAETEAQIAQKTAMDQLTPSLGKAADWAANLARTFPLTTAAVVSAAPPLAALAGAASMASVAMGGGAGSAVGRAAVLAGQVGAKEMTFAKIGVIAGTGAMVGDYALGKAFGEESKYARYGSAALNGAALGATLGSVVPVLGTAAGAAIGGVGGLAVEGWNQWQKMLQPADQPQMKATLDIGLPPGLVITKQSMQSTGLSAQMNTGNVHTGAP